MSCITVWHNPCHPMKDLQGVSTPSSLNSLTCLVREYHVRKWVLDFASSIKSDDGLNHHLSVRLPILEKEIGLELKRLTALIRREAFVLQKFGKVEFPLDLSRKIDAILKPAPQPFVQFVQHPMDRVGEYQSDQHPAHPRSERWHGPVKQPREWRKP